jgi:hypothetical protein
MHFVTLKTKAHPFLRTGFDFNQSFESPTGFCPTLSETLHKDNYLNPEVQGVNVLASDDRSA